MNRNDIYYGALLLTLTVALSIFLTYGIGATGLVTMQNQSQVSGIMTGLLTVDGLLLGLTSRFKEALGETKAGLAVANKLEALQILVLTISMLVSLVTILEAAFSGNPALVGAWFETSIITFYLVVAFYSGLAIVSRRDAVKNVH